jgi:transmembrane sensor
MSYNQQAMKKKDIDINLITKYLLTRETKAKEMIDKKIHDDEKSRRNFDAYVEVWEKSADLKDFDKIDATSDWQKVRSRIHFNTSKKRISAPRYFLRIAAILILALGLTYILSLVVKEFKSQNTFYFETLATNELKTIELPDGSTVYLNKNSKIIRNADFDTKNRDIILEGEALFNVAHNENLAFRVHTLNTIIEDIGTCFDIKADTTQVIVGVLSGKVVFYESKNTRNRVELLPQNTGCFNTVTNKISIDSTFDLNRIGWHTGIFIMQNKPLQETFEDITKFFNLGLKIDPDIKLSDSLKVSCKGHSLQDLVINLNLALHTKNIEVEAKDNQLIVRRP